MSLSIRPTRYPVDPDTQADLFDQAIAAGQTGKQDTLVSGTNIKTVNGNSLLGSGDLSISTSTAWGGITGTLSSQTDLNSALNAKQNALVSGTNIKSVNGTSLLGSGNITVTASGAPQIIAKKHMLSLSGSGVTLTASQDISAYVTSNGMLQVTGIFRKLTGTGSFIPRIYINSSASLTGATVLATFGTIANTNLIMDNIANFVIDVSGNTIYAIGTSGSGFTRYQGTSTGSLISIPSPCYLLWSAQLAGTDTAMLLNSTAILYA